MSIHFGQYTCAPKKLEFVDEENRETPKIKLKEPLVRKEDLGDEFIKTDRSYKSLLEELNGLVSDMYHPKDVSEMKTIVSFLNRILQCSDVPSLMADMWVNMVEKYQSEIEKAGAANESNTSSSTNGAVDGDIDIQAKKAELEEKRAERDKLVEEIQNLHKKMGPNYSYTQFMSDIKKMEGQIASISAEISALEKEIGNYESTHGANSSTESSVTENVTNVMYDDEGNKIGETILLKDAEGNTVSEKNIQYGKDGSVASEITRALDKKGNVSSEEIVNYDNGKPTGYLVNNYEYDENGKVSSKTSVELDKNKSKVGSRKTEYAYDESGDVASATYTTYDKKGNKTGVTVDQLETIATENGFTTRTLSRTRDFYEDGKLTGSSKSEYKYNEDGSVAAETNTHYDVNGKEVGGQIVEYNNDGTVSSRKSVSFDRDEAGNIRSKRIVDDIDSNSGIAKHGTIEYFDKAGNKTGSSEFTVVTNESGRPVSETEVRYNESGVKVSETNKEYDSEWRNAYEKTVFFDEAGNKTGSTEFKQVFREDGQLESQTAVEYDADGNVISTSTMKSECDENGKVISENYSTANKDGVEVTSGKTFYMYDSNGELQSKETFETWKDDNGNILKGKSTIRDTEDNVLYEETVNYNENAAISSGDTVHYKADGSVKERSHYEVEFDDRGAEVSKTTDNFDENGVKVSSSTIATEYDEEGNVVSKTETTVHFDAKGNNIGETTTVFDADGNKISDINTKRNEDGNQIATASDIKETTYKLKVDGEWVDCKLEIATEKDADGNVISETKIYYNEKGELSSTSKNEYENGVRVKNTFYNAFGATDGDRQIESTEVTYYDETGEKEVSRTSESRYKDNGNLYQTSNIEYDKDGKTKNWDITYYNPEGGLQSHVVRAFDEKGNETSTKDEYENGKLTKTTVTAKEGNNNKFREIISYDDNEKPISKSHADYDENGKKTGTVLEEYTYSSSGVLQSIKVTTSDSKGFPKSVETINCDANGNPIVEDKDSTTGGDEPVTQTTGNESTTPTTGSGTTKVEKVDPSGIDPATLDFSKHTVEKPASTDIPYVAGSKTKTEVKGAPPTEITTQTAPDGSVIKRVVHKNADGSINSIALTKYNSSGNVISSVSHNNYGTDNAYVVETYKDANGRPTSEKQYSLDASGNVKAFHLRTWTYNADGTNTKTETDYDKDGNVTGINIVKSGKDPNGKETTLASSKYDKDGNLTYTRAFEYNAVTDDKSVYCTKTEVTYKEGNAKVVTVTKYNRKNEELATRTEEYDKNGNLTVVREYDKKTSSSRTERYYYDSEGNPTYAKIEVDERDESKHSVSNTTITIYYNSDGTREEITSVYDYSTGETTKTKKLYDANGNPINS